MELQEWQKLSEEQKYRYSEELAAHLLQLDEDISSHLMRRVIPLPASLILASSS